MTNPNFDAVLATTLKNYRKRLTNQVFMGFALGYWLMEKGRTRMEDGGESVVEPIRSALGQAETYDQWDQFAITPQAGITAAEYPWKLARASVAISGLERAKNKGSRRIVNLLEAKVEQAEDALKSLFNTMFWADGTGDGGQHWNGLRYFIHDDPTAAATVGGIPQDTATYWRNKTYAPGTPPTTVAVDLAHIKHLVNLTTELNEKPDALFTDLALWEAIESKFTAVTQYRDVKAVNAGFDNIAINRVPLFYDNSGSAENDAVFAINSKYLTVVGLADDWFESSGFMDGTASAHATSGAASAVDGQYSVIHVYGNLSCSKRASLGVTYNLKPA